MCNIYCYISHIYTHTLKISGYMCNIFCYISHNLIGICRFHGSYLNRHTTISSEPRFTEQLLHLGDVSIRQKLVFSEFIFVSDLVLLPLHLTLESCLYGRSIICMISTTELIGNLSRELCRQRTKSTVFGQMILVYHDPFVMSTRHGLHINQVHFST